jgi:serine/threonine protein kinase
MAVRSSPNTPPLSIGRYEISGRIGTGGMGSVYRARDTDSDSLVTLQLIPAQPAKAGQYDRLAQEFRAAAEVEHPNTLRLLDFGSDGEYWYLVTEWVEGTTLARMIEAHARLPEETALRILTQVGQAIDYVRTRNLPPCKVTPSDVVIRGDGVAKLVTFALARGCVSVPAMPPRPGTGMSGASPGIPPAVPPGSHSGVRTAPEPAPTPKTPQIDDPVYWLGATLFEAVTGHPWTVEQGTPAPVVPRRGRSRRTNNPKRAAAALSTRVDMAIRRATDPDPTRRPASCAEFLKLLRGRSHSVGVLKPDSRPGGEAIEDRRASVRYALEVGSSCTIHTSVFGGAPAADTAESQEVWPLVVKDVSVGGVGILLARRCEPGTELLIDLAAGSSRVPRSLHVRVVRVRRENLGHWIHGCQFLTPLEEQELASLLSHLGRGES